MEEARESRYQTLLFFLSLSILIPFIPLLCCGWRGNDDEQGGRELMRSGGRENRHHERSGAPRWCGRW
jgi:hypothetical protein